MMCALHGVQHMFDLPWFLIPKAFLFNPIGGHAEIIFQNVFHRVCTYFVCASIYPDIIVRET